MENIATLLSYFKKLQKEIDRPELSFMNYRLLKKNRIDDILVCSLSLLPKSFKNKMEEQLEIDDYPSISCYSRLLNIVRKPFFLNPNLYIVDYTEITAIIKNICKNIENDTKKLESKL